MSKIRDIWLQRRLSYLNQLSLAREGYRESSTMENVERWRKSLPEETRSAVKEIEAQYKTEPHLEFLSLVHYRLALSTLMILKRIDRALAENSNPLHQILPAISNRYFHCAEFGAHTFARAPALMSFFDHHNLNISLVGYELAPFPTPFSLHSVYDIARHICRNLPRTRYVQADVSKLCGSHQQIFFFYPFVSENPATAWKIPGKFGNPNLLRHSLENNLVTGGLAYIVHQGEWEWEIFHKVTKSSRLRPILEPITYRCKILPTQFPAVLTLYQKV